MQQHPKYLIGLLGLILMSEGVLSSTVGASENKERKPFVYKIDKASYESQEGAIIEGQKIFVEVQELAQFLGYEAIYRDQMISFRKIDTLPDNMGLFEEATIIKVDKENNQFTILPKGTDDLTEHLITISMGKEATIEYPLLHRIFPFDVLKEGMKVSIRYLAEKLQTLHYYEATYVEILTTDGELKDMLPALENVYILEINKEKQYLVVGTEKDTLLDVKKTVVHVDHHTNIKDTLGRSAYGMDKLKVGQLVTIITNGVTTRSEPPHTVGLEIIVYE